MFSIRYSGTSIKKYDGINKGSSSLWAVRMNKAYGSLPITKEHDLNSDNRNFDYSEQQISIARKFRCGIYQRILNFKDIKKALCYCPVVLDFEIFDSIYNDIDGIISLPDEKEDIKESFGHSVVVIGHDINGYIILNNWVNWGNKGVGHVSLDYLEKYFITAFASNIILLNKKKNYVDKKEIKINNQNYLFFLFKEMSFVNNKKIIFNIEIFNKNNILVGWTHFICIKNSIEILDIFILKEFREKGLGTALLNQIIFYTNDHIEITGYISGFDLLNNRDEVVKNFLIKNGLTVDVDISQFKDCKNKIIKI